MCEVCGYTQKIARILGMQKLNTHSTRSLDLYHMTRCYNIDISGLLGLCMGFSFVSLTEIIYYLVKGVVKGVKRMLCGKKTEDMPEGWADNG